jgi:cysteine desulfurase
VTYLDHNATTPVRPAAAAAVAAALARIGNPSSVHAAGRAARRELERARERVAALVGAAPEEIVFTSGGTEANNLALRGTGRRTVVVSAIEHDSVLNAVEGARVVPATPSGVVDLRALAATMPEGALVSLMLANNETGVIQPVAEAAALVHARGGLLHVDAVQAAGKIPVDMRALGADLMTLSAHKLGGPQGVGALVARTDVAAQLRGGGQERGRRAGTENLPGIAGFGAAAAEPGDYGRLAALRDAVEEALAGEAVFFGREAPRLSTTTCLALPGVPAETQVIALDLAGVMVSAGAACSSGKVRPSHVLGAMGVGAELAASAIRVSFGWTSTEADVEAFLGAWRQMRDRAALRRSAA